MRKLVRAELHFNNARPLIATSFVKLDNKYRAIVKNTWVYNTLIVDVYPQPELDAFHQPSIRVYVGESNVLLNTADSGQDVQIYEAYGIMRDKTFNPWVDSASFMHEDKRAHVKLYQNYTSNERGSIQGHLITIKHMGNGSFNHYTPLLPFDAKAIASDVQDINGYPEYSIRYRHADGSLGQTTFTSVRELFVQQ